MSTTTTPRQGTAAPAINLWPQVDLLPKEVRAGRRLKQTKRLLGLALVGTVLVAVVGWAVALLQVQDAKNELADAVEKTEWLTAEQAKYAEVPQVKGQLSRMGDALEQTTATEVLWSGYLEAFRAVTPAPVSYESIQATMTTDPTADMSVDPLQAPSLGQIVFSARSTTLPDVAAWMDAVRAVPGLSDPWFGQAAVTDEDENVFYRITGTVQVTDAALAHRFATEAEEGS